MAISILSNPVVLGAQRRLAHNSAQLETSYARLGSGMRITSAGDDAAGLAVSSLLNSRSRIYTQAIKNMNDGISLLQIAEGALREIVGITDRQKELAEQAANGVYSSQQRAALDREAKALSEESSRILSSTSFNGEKLFSGEEGRVIRIQGGFGVEEGIEFVLGPGSAAIGSRGNGTFTAVGSFEVGTGEWSAVDLRDVNGDRVTDLITTDYGDDTVSVLLGNGDGTFKARASFRTGDGPEGGEIVDINGDSLLDIVTTEYDSNTVSMLLGNGDGTFRAATSISVGAFPEELTIGDLNGDQHLDIVTTDSGANSLSLLLGNGDGTFKSRLTYALGGAPVNPILGDFNGDGRTDIVASTYSGANNTTYVLLGNGDGTFTASSTFSSSGKLELGEWMMRSGDINRDGRLDLVSTNPETDVLSTMLGNGDGTFRLGASFSTNAEPASLVLSNFDSDQYLDMMVADYSSNTVTTFIGNGDGTYRAGVSFAIGSGPRSLATGDLNGDGVHDFAVLNTTDRRVRILVTGNRLGRGRSCARFHPHTYRSEDATGCERRPHSD